MGWASRIAQPFRMEIYPGGVSATVLAVGYPPPVLEEAMSTNLSRTYVVHGMSCGHCVASVREEVSSLEGVEAIEFDLGSGRLTVSGGQVDDDSIRAAVTAAGYEVRS